MRFYSRIYTRPGHRVYVVLFSLSSDTGCILGYFRQPNNRESMVAWIEYLSIAKGEVSNWCHSDEVCKNDVEQLQNFYNMY